jgi:4-hydroxy-tetrahydrodipicolinate reductase
VTGSRPPVRLVLVGFGRANQAVLELALTRPWLDVVGVVVRSAERDGEAAGDRVPSAPTGLVCSTDLAGTLRRTRPDVAIVATATHLSDVYPVLSVVAESGTPMICTAEDLAHIRREDPAPAADIIDLAVRHGVAIVASGANPGFVLDVWPLTLAGLAWDIERLRARRIVDVSVFGPRVRRSLGIDLTPGEFRAGIADGSVVGHAGFPESLRILAESMGRALEQTTIVSEPLTADAALTLSDGTVIDAGRTVGADQRATGWYAGGPWLEIAMTLHVDPAHAGLAPTDEVEISGRHPLRVRVDPGYRALLSTAAVLVNGIPQALSAPPGVHRPGDLGLIAPWFADEPPPARSRGAR